jgi:hypothetical protein
VAWGPEPGGKKFSRGSGILDQGLPPALLNAAFSFSDKAFLGVCSKEKIRPFCTLR